MNNCSTVAVFQGEYAAVQSCEGRDSFIKTSTPFSCIVFTLYNRARKIAVLAHIDDYTSIRSTINKVELTLRGKFGTSLSKKEFTGCIMGGTDEFYSKQNKRLTLEMLGAMEINPREITIEGKYGKGPQVAINALDGKFSYFSEDRVNLTFEFWQQREYGDFNSILDFHYGFNCGGKIIPAFDSKAATRYESDFGEINLSSEEKLCWVKAHIKRVPHLCEHVKAVRRPLASQEEAQKKISELVYKKFAKFKPLHKSLAVHNYNLMFRQSATDRKCFELFKLLFTYSSELSIDFTSKGKNSGTVWDVIAKYHRIDCENFLKGKI